jgi:PAS domain S-box-containing protein
MDGVPKISLADVIGHIGDYTDDAILITDAEPIDLPGPRIVWANKAFCRMTGYSLEDVIGKTPRILQGEDTDAAELDRLREGLKSWKAVRVELKNYRKDGTPFWVDLGIQPVTDASGWHRFWVAIQRETTERHEREQLLARTMRIIESAPVALGLLTADNRLSFANEHFSRLLFRERMPPALPLPYGSWLWRAFDKPDATADAEARAAEWIRLHLAGLYSTPGRIEQRLDGRWHEFRRLATSSGDQLIIGGEIEDRIQLQEQLRHMTKIDAMGQLTSGVAHDFNNILAVILGNVELLQIEAAKSENRNLFIAETIAAVLKGRSLTESLLSFARKSRLEPKTCNVLDLCSETVRMFRRTAATAVDVTLDFPADLPNIFVDPHLFQNALLNLLINARDATTSNGIISVSARVLQVAGGSDIGTGGTGEATDQVEVSVRDEGAGMDAVVAGRAIEPFFTTKRGEGGSGLGLSVVHGFMEQSSGTLSIQSSPNAGTTISLKFPVHLSTSDEIVDNDVGESLPPGTRILLVEDEPSLRKLLVRMLKTAGASVVAAESGDHAVEMKPRWNEFDLLMTDILMPGIVQGDMLARQFAERCPDTPVVLLSGNPEIMNATFPRGAKRTLVLSKPIQRNELVGNICRLL